MAINLKKKNFAFSQLASGIGASDTSLTVSSGDGSKFPSTGVFRAVIWGQNYVSPEQDATREIIEAQLSSGDTFSITRAKEGTTAKAWNAGDKIALVITEETFTEIETEINNHISSTSAHGVSGNIIGGTISAGQLAFGINSNTIGGDNNLYLDNNNKRLGIRTINPTQKLHVEGNAYISGNVGIGTTNPNERLSLWRNSGDINIKLNPNNTPVSGYIGRFQRNNDNVAGTSYYTYISNGAVHVNGSDENTFFVENQYVDAQIITMNRHGFRFLVADATSNNQDVTATELMRLTFDGRLGIGTNAPSEKLHIVGNILGTGNLTIQGTATIAGMTLTGNLNLNNKNIINSNPVVNINFQTGTSYTLTLTDAGQWVAMNNANANTVTIPTNATVAFPVGTRITIQKYGAGNTTIQAASGVTLRNPNDAATITAQYDVRVIVKTGTDEWVII